MPILFDLGKYPNKYFIETGTYMGEGINKAIECNAFTYIYSIEIDTLRHLTCKELFSTFDNITLIKGDSAILLKLVLKHVKEPCTFWLDAHFCGDDGELGSKWCPLVEELEAIKNHPIKNHTIIIDDYRCMDNTHFDKERNIPVGFPGKKKLLEILQNINPDYSIVFLDGVTPKDIVVARIDFEEIAKETINNLINSIEYDENIEIITGELVEKNINESISELENEGKIFSTSILNNIIDNIDKISKDYKEKKLRLKELELIKWEEKLKNQKNQKNNNLINIKEFKIIEQNIHKLDEELNKKGIFLKEKEQRLSIKEEELKIKEETIHEIILDLHLQKEIKRYNTLEKKSMSRTSRKNRRKKKK